MVCLLGRPWHLVFSRPWNWTAHLPSLSGNNDSFSGNVLSMHAHIEAYTHMHL